MPSTYFSRLNIIFRPGFRRLIIGQELGFQNSLVVLGERKLLFGISGLSISAPFSTLAEGHSFLPPATVTAQTLNSQLVNQRRNISVVGTSSHIFPVPSVSGSSYQICGIHVNSLLSSSTKILTGNPLLKIPMATSDSVAVSMYNLSPRQVSHSNYATCAGVFCSKRSFDNCRKASMCLKYEEPSNRYAIYGYLTFSSVRRNFKSNKRLGPASKDFHSPSYLCYSAGAAPDVSFDGSRDEHVTSSSVSSGQEMVDYRTLKLLSGSCYLPHPDKEETGGDDAHFICVHEQAIGVADGVGGWAAVGVDAGKYARELMSNSVTAIQEEPKGSINPARVLEKAHSITKAEGSSTACIIALTDQGVHAINLGDSGFIVIRDGSTVFRSPVQQHDFNFTYQLECGSNGDLPSSGEVFAIPVVPGDVIIAGTDGLFDNLYNNEVNTVVVQAKRAGMGPQVTAEKIAALARQRAQDKNRQTPFSSAAQDAGFRYYGGKLDDITVIVSYITSLTNV